MDQRHIINICAAKRFNRNWELGLNGDIHLQTHLLRTMNPSMNQSYWDIFGQGILDYDLLNTQRNNPFHHLDVRIDKYYFNNWTLNLYLDLENIYNKVHICLLFNSREMN